MIDKDLSELKNNVPDYNINDYKNGIYEKYNNNKNCRRLHVPKLAFISIIFIMFIFIIVLGTYATKVEAKEYQNAVEFFEANELSFEGLTRTEIKEIYRDITTNKFKYRKTGEVIVESIKSKISGYSIELDNITSNELMSVWELWDKLREKSESLSDIYYNYELFKTVREDGSIDFTKSIFTKYDNGIEIWNLDIYYFINGYIEKGDYLLVYGNQLNCYSHINEKKTYLSKISKDGEVIWEQEFDDSNRFYNIIINNDDSITAFTNKNFNNSYLKIYNLDSNGKILDMSENFFEKYELKNVVKLNEYYLLYLEDRDYNSKFVRINYDGLLESEFSYHDENYRYFFTDMIEFENRVYLSAYGVPYFEDAIYGRGEIRKLLDILQRMERNGEEITDDFVLNLFKDYYKAVLFVCDKHNGDIKTFYNIDSAIGSKFIIKDDKLIWEVEYLQSMMYSPGTSSFTFGGVTQVYNYIYDEKGQFIGINKTDELRVLRK